MVQKGYRDVPYHNWGHAFSVGHFCYLILRMPDVVNALSELERFSLLVASLCHDIDHRGTTNAFQLQSVRTQNKRNKLWEKKFLENTSRPAIQQWRIGFGEAPFCADCYNFGNGWVQYLRAVNSAAVSNGFGQHSWDHFGHRHCRTSPKSDENKRNDWRYGKKY